jgi:pilus assembly protein FimV
MTEVGTKLDLARAYVDMGDPDGARSILNEVIEEGDPAQQQEARKLLDELAD